MSVISGGKGTGTFVAALPSERDKILVCFEIDEYVAWFDIDTIEEPSEEEEDLLNVN